APGARDRLSPEPSAAVDGGPAGDVLQLEIQRRRAAAVAIPAVAGGADAGGQRAPQTVERESRPQQPSRLPPPPAPLPEPDPAPHADSRSTATRPVDATATTRDSQSAGNARPVA